MSLQRRSLSIICLDTPLDKLRKTKFHPSAKAALRLVCVMDQNTDNLRRKTLVAYLVLVFSRICYVLNVDMISDTVVHNHEST